MSDLDLLAALLSDEHAAVYGYGVLGARLTAAAQQQALDSFDAHRVARDDVIARLRAAGRTPAGPHPAYDVSVPTRTAALALAVRIEESLGVRWRDLVGGTTDPGLRRAGVAGLQGCAIRATQWRRVGGARPGTTALPGVV